MSVRGGERVQQMMVSQPNAGTPIPSLAASVSRPDPEVAERAHRRQFTASYKLRVLQEADACKDGELGALLRREGLYSSHLTRLRRACGTRACSMPSGHAVAAARPRTPRPPNWPGCVRTTSA